MVVEKASVAAEWKVDVWDTLSAVLKEAEQVEQMVGESVALMVGWMDVVWVEQ